MIISQEVCKGPGIVPYTPSMINGGFYLYYQQKLLAQ